ncbi:DNA photolyase family protein [Burkholderiaceae bacterium FT117]|uniref:cryptochrome/photolyase family protein n=1 Tax=Zeimonas sediminis TaxID=2944268 RepID=UPI002342F001|nr:deoxyribodipyrimidine photo-lyase [Zeimonas sediminis]MCM5572395.1 DNA photolyase family protein [Zeimonas sediminis]
MTTPPPGSETALVWLRRDLRLSDHAALSAALDDFSRVHLVFMFDRDILDPLPGQEQALPPDGPSATPAGPAQEGVAPASAQPAGGHGDLRHDRRVEFIWRSIAEIDARLRELGGALHVVHGRPRQAIPALAARLEVAAVYANHDYEPAAIARDEAVRAALAADGREFRTFKDQAVFERDEVLTGQGKPFSVFTPYRNAWMKRLSDIDLAERPVALAARLAPAAHAPSLPALESLGFAGTNLLALGIEPGEAGARRALSDFADRIGRYREARDFPAVRGPSYLSVHLRFGTLSIRAAARLALQTMRADPGAAEGASTWLNELIWRDFYFQILHHHPHVVDRAFRPEYDAIRWVDGVAGDALFDAWREARTGYPIVDAAIAQIRRSGYMHNRLRMIVASFLVKDLGVDWRRGERWFADQLNDYDLAANNGGWQWAASTGCDAQPYFRIFNPVTQSQKFDPQGKFIRRYLPQLANLSDKAIHAPWLAPAAELERAGVRLGVDYPLPIVDHAAAREATLGRFAAARAA